MLASPHALFGHATPHQAHHRRKKFFPRRALHAASLGPKTDAADRLLGGRRRWVNEIILAGPLLYRLTQLKWPEDSPTHRARSPLRFRLARLR